MKRGANGTENLTRKKTKKETQKLKLSTPLLLPIEQRSAPFPDVDSGDFDITIDTIIQLTKDHLQIDIPASMKLLMVELHRNLYKELTSERLSYQCHLIVLFNRFLKAKWPITPISPLLDDQAKQIIKTTTEQELLKGYIGAVIVCTKMVCDQTVWNSDISKYIQKIHDEQLTFNELYKTHCARNLEYQEVLHLKKVNNLLESFDILNTLYSSFVTNRQALSKFEYEFMDTLNWELGVIANEAQTVMLMYLSKYYNQFCLNGSKKDQNKASQLLEDSKVIFESLLKNFGKIDNATELSAPNPLLCYLYDSPTQDTVTTPAAAAIEKPAIATEKYRKS